MSTLFGDRSGREGEDARKCKGFDVERMTANLASDSKKRVAAAVKVASDPPLDN